MKELFQGGEAAEGDSPPEDLITFQQISWEKAVNELPTLPTLSTHPVFLHTVDTTG